MAIVSPLQDQYFPAKMRRPRDAGTRPRIVVNHMMEASETLTRAEDLGRNYFADPRDKAGKQVYASTHDGCDADSIAGYVFEDELAYGSHGNTWALHMEHAGFNSQTDADWFDWFGIAMLDRSARWAADACKRNDIEPTWLDADALSDRWSELGKGSGGITDHLTMTTVLGAGSGHVDHFGTAVRRHYMTRVARYTADPAARPILVQGDRSGKKSLGASAGRPEIGDKRATGAPADLQTGLVTLGYDIGPYGIGRDGVDGNPGPATFGAVALLRNKNGLEASPIVDDAVWAIIDRTEPQPEPEPEPELTLRGRIRQASRLITRGLDILQNEETDGQPEGLTAGLDMG